MTYQLLNLGSNITAIKKNFRKISGDDPILDEMEKEILIEFMKDNKKKFYHHFSSRETDLAFSCILQLSSIWKYFNNVGIVDLMQKSVDIGNIMFLLEVVMLYEQLSLIFGKIDDTIFYLNQLVYSIIYHWIFNDD